MAVGLLTALLASLMTALTDLMALLIERLVELMIVNWDVVWLDDCTCTLSATGWLMTNGVDSDGVITGLCIECSSMNTCFFSVCAPSSSLCTLPSRICAPSETGCHFHNVVLNFSLVC